MNEATPTKSGLERMERARELYARWEATLQRDLEQTPTVRDELMHRSDDHGFKQAFAELPNRLPVWLQYTLLGGGFGLMGYLWIVR